MTKMSSLITRQAALSSENVSLKEYPSALKNRRESGRLATGRFTKILVLMGVTFSSG